MFLEALNINFGNRIECYAKPSNSTLLAITIQPSKGIER
jgi:hypothetical protein